MSVRAHPILERFPTLRTSHAPLSLCTLPTRVHALPSLGAHAWIKRDDETHPEVAGNKLRKLEWVGASLVRARARRAVLLGATGTNAGVAAAMVLKGLGVSLEVMTFPQPPSSTVERNRALMGHYGATLRARGPLLTAALAWQLSPRRLEDGTVFLPAGCSTPESTLAYVDAALELKAQMDAGECPEFEDIVVAAGSGATLAGLTLGCALAGLRTRVLGVRVAPLRVGPFAACAPQTIARMMAHARATLAALDRAVPDAPPPVLEGAWYGAGYGAPTDAGARAIDAFAREGITLEQTYTGKAAAAFLARVQAAKGPVLFWNTFSARPDPPGFRGNVGQ